MNRWCVLFAGACLTLGACVEEGPEAPPLRGVLGPTRPRPVDGGAGMENMAGGGGMGMGGTGGQGGQGGQGGSAGDAADAGPDAADAADAG